ncbi:tyrosine-type recombinase/integrase [Arthrobacter sp. Cr_A7]|uniref:tyrosine-type recombinase/integrase n=1 Tax=Arthrobacter sp. Cr_A7 TaxID=3031017 RepID=UPI0023DBA5A7|nr:tyrosine-type recombinase/integrase [Arthrobacter sp. Cr_A7]MDF2051608.1 tyrosine-type recombinase/integrase [Arthrobacter sp. Cr_A7]
MLFVVDLTNHVSAPRRMEGLTVAEVGRVATRPGIPGFVIVDPAGVEFAPATDYFLELVASDYSPRTVRTYALSLLRFLRFLWAVGVRWDQASALEARDFVLWARQVEKFVGNRSEPERRPSRNLVTGKRHPGMRYSSATINHTTTVCKAFYAYQLRQGRGPVVNPFDLRRGRAHAHHDPGRDFALVRRQPLRQREARRVPRSIPDERFNDLFRRLRSNRDRALVAFYVSSGARASELLGLTGDRINVGDQLIGVYRKGGQLQWLPAAPDAFVWLRLYQLEAGVAGADEPVWLTLRGEPRPLGYEAMRAVLKRCNGSLGANWTLHDLRHTFAIRALEGGMGLHEVQELLGHKSLDTTTVYSTPHMDDVIAHYRTKITTRSPVAENTAPVGQRYNPDELSVLWGNQ